VNILNTKIGIKEQVLNEIIFSITSGEKKAGDCLRSKDYNAGRQMSAIYKCLIDADIVKINSANFYVLTDNCSEKAQALYFDKILDLISLIRTLAEAANLSPECLADLFKSEVNKQK
jgi:DNA-binding transcriptional regulator YhcF (GntR family)